jgi:hypothetical protein
VPPPPGLRKASPKVVGQLGILRDAGEQGVDAGSATFYQVIVSCSDKAYSAFSSVVLESMLPVLAHGVIQHVSST